MRTLAVVAAFAALALTLSACVTIKPGSVQISQPGGIGGVHISFQLCTAEEGPGPPGACDEDDYTGDSQVVLSFILTRGVTDVPASFSAAPGPTPGAQPIVFHRNTSLDAQLNELPLPPHLEPISYLSEVISEEASENFEWSASFSFGLPAAPNGGSFAGRSDSSASPVGAKSARNCRPIAPSCVRVANPR
jgi:hypothetical protein